MGMVMCPAAHDTRLRLLLELGLSFYFFPLFSTIFTGSFAVGQPLVQLKVGWYRVERGARRGLHWGISHPVLSLFVWFMCTHMVFGEAMGQGQGESQMDLITGAGFCGKLCVQLQDAPLR